MEKDLCKAITDLLRIADGIYFQRLNDMLPHLLPQLGGKLNKIKKLTN
jgi:hypothetical protein